MDPPHPNEEEPVPQEQDGEETKDPRPRRADAETLSYLRSLEPMVDKALSQRAGKGGPAKARDEAGVEEENEDDGEDTTLLVDNMLEELTFKVKRGTLHNLDHGVSMRPVAAALRRST